MVIITLVKAKNMDINLNFIQVFNNGKVLFHLNNEKSFSYDLFYTGDGLPVKFLKIYEDNKNNRI